MYSALIEISQPTLATDETLHTTLTDLMAAQTVQNALIAENLSQAEQFWRMRWNFGGAKAQGKNIKHDVSVPISAIAQFIERTDVALALKIPRHSNRGVRTHWRWRIFQCQRGHSVCQP